MNQIQKAQGPTSTSGSIPETTLKTIRSLTTGIKIRDLKNDVSLKQELAHCVKLTGLKHIFTELETQVLINFIIGAYGGLCTAELSHAFKLGCKGTLPVDMNHYQNFSAEYLGRVLKAYSEYRSKELANNQVKLERPPEPTVDRMEYYEEQLFSKYDEIKHDKYLFSEYDENRLYHLLTEFLHLNVATKTEKNLAMEDAEKIEPKARRENKAIREIKVKSRAKRICFRNWIKRMSFEDIDLRTEITKLL